MRSKPFRGRLAAAFVVATAWGCAGPKTSVTQTWKASAMGERHPMRTMFVFATNMDETNRRAFEDAFTSALRDHGVAARPSYELFPGGLPDRHEARAAARRAGVEGILVVTNEGTRQESTYVPGAYAGDFWGGYYGSPTGMGRGAYTPGYIATTEIANLETTLWDVRVDDGQLVWSIGTNTTERKPDASYTKSVVSRVVPEITKAGLIPAKGK